MNMHQLQSRLCVLANLACMCSDHIVMYYGIFGSDNLQLAHGIHVCGYELSSCGCPLGSMPSGYNCSFTTDVIYQAATSCVYSNTVCMYLIAAQNKDIPSY